MFWIKMLAKHCSNLLDDKSGRHAGGLAWEDNLWTWAFRSLHYDAESFCALSRLQEGNVPDQNVLVLAATRVAMLEKNPGGDVIVSENPIRVWQPDDLDKGEPHDEHAPLSPRTEDRHVDRADEKPSNPYKAMQDLCKGRNPFACKARLPADADWEALKFVLLPEERDVVYAQYELVRAKHVSRVEEDGYFALCTMEALANVQRLVRDEAKSIAELSETYEPDAVASLTARKEQLLEVTQVLGQFKKGNDGVINSMLVFEPGCVCFCFCEGHRGGEEGCFVVFVHVAHFAGLR